MAITGTHMLFYTSEAEQLRAMLRDVFGFKHVDAGGGWLIFRLPPSEIGVHPAEGPTYESGARHQITFMCDDINTDDRRAARKRREVDDRHEGRGLRHHDDDAPARRLRRDAVRAAARDRGRHGGAKACEDAAPQRREETGLDEGYAPRGRRAKKAGRRR